MAQPVHWQSAFWGLAALALNSAVQDSGRVLGLRAKYQLALKKSLLICLFDTIHTIFSVARQYRHTSLRSSLQSAAAVRRVHEHRAKHVKLAERVLSITVSVAAILQLIKLSALNGVPWTQAFGAFYFASYLVQEGLYHFDAPTNPGEILHEGQPRRSSEDLLLLASSVVILQSLLNCYITGASFGSSPNEGRLSGAYYAAVLCQQYCGRYGLC